MKKYFLTSWILAVVAGLILTTVPAHAQQYQKAKDTLRGVSLKDVMIYQDANITSKKIIQLPRNTTVLVYGKKGPFLDLKYQNLRGWGLASSFTIKGPATQAPEPPVQVREEQRQEPQEPTRERDAEELPIRINPFGSYVLAGKSFDKQLRLGVSGTYATSKHLQLGAVSDFVFIKGTYLDFGPIIRTQWNDQSAFFNPAFYVGFLYYSFNHNSVKDEGFGLQWSFENEIPIMRSSEFQPSILMKVGADMMFFYFDEVRIPYFFSLGAVFRF